MWVFPEFAIFCGGELRMSSTQRAQVIVSSMTGVTVRVQELAPNALVVKYDDERE